MNNELTSVFFSPQDVPAQRVALNLGAPDTDPISEAQAYQRQRDTGMTLDEIATAANESRERITRRLALLTLAPDIQHYVKAGYLPSALAAKLVGLSPSYQRKTYIAYVNGKAKTPARFTELVKDSQVESERNRRLDLAALTLPNAADFDTLTPDTDAWATDGGALEILPEQNDITPESDPSQVIPRISISEDEQALNAITERIRSTYGWTRITDSYSDADYDLFERLLEARLVDRGMDGRVRGFRWVSDRVEYGAFFLASAYRMFYTRTPCPPMPSWRDPSGQLAHLLDAMQAKVTELTLTQPLKDGLQWGVWTEQGKAFMGIIDPSQRLGYSQCALIGCLPVRNYFESIPAHLKA